jgi:pimeloyl-ACP methyl ester carboxylesterase
MGARGKPPVLFIHGAFCGSWALENFHARFAAAGYQVHAPALRFHDAAVTPDALADTGLGDYAADLEEEIAALEVPPILVGHAMGGLLAQMLASRRAVAAAILLAPLPPWGVPPSTLFEIATAQALLLKAGLRRGVVAPARATAFLHTLRRLPPEMRDAVTPRLVAESGRALFETLHWGLDINRASAVAPARAACPLLLVAGSEDRIAPPGTVARIAALYKDRAVCETAPGMGHWLQGEPGWEDIADRALAWLDGPL